MCVASGSEQLRHILFAIIIIADITLFDNMIFFMNCTISVIDIPKMDNTHIHMHTLTFL